MILQALNRYYDQLVEDGALERPGWQPVKVAYALQIDDAGTLVRVLPLMTEVERGKKKVMVPREFNLPAQVKRSVGIAANFLCDNATYMLGLDFKDKPERALKCFQACGALHAGLLSGLESGAARAILNFFGKWRPEDAPTCEALRDCMEDLRGGANLTFAYGETFVDRWPDIQRRWDEAYNHQGEGIRMRCLVTGESAPPARLHPNIKGVAGGQPMGTTLVGFNAPAFESFGRDGEQGFNAPVSEKAAFAYSAALNYLIAKRETHIRLSDATIVYWAEHGEACYSDFMSAIMGGGEELDAQDLHDAFEALAAGRKPLWREKELDPQEPFYILGLSPNAARLSVRFFLRNSFGGFAENVWRHHERLEIARPGFDARVSLSFWDLLNETVNQKSRDKMPSPLLSGALVRAALMDQPYPMLLYDQVMLRVRAEHQVTRGRAAIIKAFLMKNAVGQKDDKAYEEALSVELNENTNYQPYLLGRLFAVLEALQQSANPGINATIRDRFFNSACATPGVVFPQLIKLAQAHLKKLETGPSIYYSRQMGDILSRFDTDYPRRLDLYDQGIFQLGYYHQVQARYTKKEDK